MLHDSGGESTTRSSLDRGTETLKSRRAFSKPHENLHATHIMNGRVD